MWRKAVQLQKTALRESFLEVIRLFFCITVVCGEICCFYGGTREGRKSRSASENSPTRKFSVSTTAFLGGYLKSRTPTVTAVGVCCSHGTSQLVSIV